MHELYISTSIIVNYGKIIKSRIHPKHSVNYRLGLMTGIGKIAIL